MFRLFDAQNNQPLGEIEDTEVDFLRDQLEEETPTDQDYYINRMTIDLLEEKGAPPHLVSLLRSALGDREDMDIRWE